MKRLLILIAIITVLMGCQTIPAIDIVLYGMTPFGPIPVLVGKGLLNASEEGKSWMKAEDFYAIEPEKPETKEGADETNT